MARLNLDNDPTPEPKPKRNRLNIQHWTETFPHFPIMKECTNEFEEDEGKKFYVWCRKDSKDGGQIIRLDVCIGSVFRFNPHSKICRRCFRIGSHQRFPEQFLAEKRSALPESVMVLKMDGKKTVVESEE